jgi:hypothetical protein
MFKLIQKETNWYAMQPINKQKKERPLKPKSVFAMWNAVTLQEIKKFSSIVILMNVLHKSYLQDYWSLHPIIQTPICSFC